MLNPIDRKHFIERGAEVTARCLYDMHEGLGDTSMVEIDGKMKLQPFLPLISQVVGKPHIHVTSIDDGQGNIVELTPFEVEDLQRLTDRHLAKLVYNKVKAMGSDTPEMIFEAAKGLMNRAANIGSILVIGMNTAKQQQVNKSRDFVIVAPYNGQGQTLMDPEPSTTGQKYGG